MKPLAENKSAFFDYDILETYEAGLVLSGAEVKAVKQGSANLKGSFVTFHNGEARLTNAHISPYRFAAALDSYNPTQSRQLLLHKKEVRYLQTKTQEKGLTVVPLKLYTKGHLVKVAIGVARGRHQFDKREVLKQRDLDRDARQALKHTG